ncbi:MAG: hypothetical protein AB4426_26965 [Xenococcaceae cyanobacterium]
MSSIFLEKTNVSTNLNPRQSTTLNKKHKSQRSRLVARWFLDENSKLYCRWMSE